MTEESVLATLRRIPDRIILAVAARDLELSQGQTCVCGWVIREHLAEMRNVGASDVLLSNEGVWIPGVPHGASGCAELFGGTVDEWAKIYWGVMYAHSDLPIIESAYVRRLDEACGFKEVS